MSLNNEIAKEIGEHASARGKTYHAPRIEDYGAVNELSKSGSGSYYDAGDGPSFYSSTPPN